MSSFAGDRKKTKFDLSPALILHFHLLGQMLGEFYMAKLRVRKLLQQSYLQAVYETGARMTHDVKKLLQSLDVLCAAAEQEAGGSNELQALMRRQLPTTTQRLQQTLEKMRQPATEDSGRFVRAGVWWSALQRSYAGRRIEFRASGVSDDVSLPKELFDGAADNLIQNALGKRKLHGDFAIGVNLACADGIRLEVCGGGRAIAAEIARDLLRAPVQSDSGLGIGLYRVARYAEVCGFTLELAHNTDGEVTFVLSSAPRPAVLAPSSASI